MNNSIVVGSLGAIARAENKSIAETFLGCDCVIIVDTSGSMGSHDSRGGQQRYDVACQELASLQKSMPGKIAVLGFSSSVQFYPSGVPGFLGGGTNMASALKFAKVADTPGMRFVMISDGWPDNSVETLQVARTFKNHIDTVFVGPEDDEDGQKFLKALSAATGGSHLIADRAKELSSTVQTLLLRG